VKGECVIYVDVTVTRPTNRSRLGDAAERERTLTTPLHACRQAANRKHAQYDEIAALNHWQMVPFVLESYGGIAPEAQALLELLASHAPSGTQQEWLQHAVSSISVALQNGNAYIATASMQQHTVGVQRQRNYRQAQRRYEVTRAPRPPRATRTTTATVHTASRPTPAPSASSSSLPRLLPHLRERRRQLGCALLNPVSIASLSRSSHDARRMP
jgi:hypothetical protein